MNNNEQSAHLGHVSGRLRQLSSEIESSYQPSVQGVLELMTTRQMLMELKLAESSEIAIQEHIDRIDRMVAQWDDKLVDVAGE